MLLAFYRKIGRNRFHNSTPQKLSFFQLLLLYGISHKNSRAGGILLGAPGWFYYNTNLAIGHRISTIVVAAVSSPNWQYIIMKTTPIAMPTSAHFFTNSL